MEVCQRLAEQNQMCALENTLFAVLKVEASNAESKRPAAGPLLRREFRDRQWSQQFTDTRLKK